MRLSTRLTAAGKRVPSDSPSASLEITFGVLPPAIATFTPEAVASLAASSFVTIPPRPRPSNEGPASASISSVNAVTTGTSRACGSVCGSPVNSPSTWPSMMSMSASTIFATIADSMSLSPKARPPSSSTATTSFSLMMGTIPKSISPVSVLRMFR